MLDGAPRDLVTPDLTQPELARLQTVFDAFDRDHSGAIAADELSDVLAGVWLFHPSLCLMSGVWDSGRARHDARACAAHDRADRPQPQRRDRCAVLRPGVSWLP
jgi:hypothetical protein